MPIAIVDYRTGFCSLIAQIFRQNAQGLNQRFAIGDVETVAIEVGEHPFVRIKSVTVCEFNSVMRIAKFGAKRGRT